MDDLVALKLSLRLSLNHQEWAELQAFLYSLPAPSEKLRALLKNDEVWPK